MQRFVVAAHVNGLFFDRCAQSFCQLHDADIITVEADSHKLFSSYAARQVASAHGGAQHFVVFTTNAAGEGEDAVHTLL